MIVASTIVPVRDADALALQIQVHRVQHLAAQLVLFQQMAEVQDRRLVRRRGAAQIDARKAAQHRRFVQSVFHAGVRQREPLLQKVNPKHDVQSYRLTAHLALRVVRRNQRQQLGPWHHRVHLGQKLLPPRLLRVALELCLMGQRHLPHA